VIQLLHNARVFDGVVCHEDAAVAIVGGMIVELIARDKKLPNSDLQIDLEGRLLAPGLIDIQVNGGGGLLFNDVPEIETLVCMSGAHRQFGTTAFLPTLISSDTETTRRAIQAVNAAIAAAVPGVVGIHLEGPFLSPDYSGVHDEKRIRKIDDSAEELLATSTAGRVMLTLAPEHGPDATITRLAGNGYIVFAGHSGASYEQVSAALQAGISGFTHLFNAMTQLVSRAPGMVGAALDDAESYVGIIVDGFHVHPASLRLAIAAKKVGKVILVTDAMPTVGSSSDEFRLGGEVVRAVDGRCLTSDGALAGSNIGMIDAVRNTIELTGVDRYEALRMASCYPAAALRLDNRMGYIRPGYQANLIELDESLVVRRSWIDGAVVDHAWT
jgi:N-acetylglucosamine-6-phosphate deacetylase